MKIHRKYTGAKGMLTVYRDALRSRYMITKQAEKRARIMVFWEKHGLDAAIEAFEMKRRTLFDWKKKWIAGGKKSEALNERPRSPKTKRKRLWDDRILSEIKRQRWEHPNLGKEKLYPMLAVFCAGKDLACPKPKTIGRLIKDMGGLRRRPTKLSHFGKVKIVNRQKALRKPMDFEAEYPGHCVAFDTIEKHVWGRRYYVITFEDLYTRFAFAWETASHASLAATEFFALCLKVFPFPIMFVLTDNGSEFMKQFDEELRRLHLVHYHTYPRTPTMNAHLERFNRTIQEEFIDYHVPDLKTPEIFNCKLVDYLVWYNTERVHYVFQNKLSPVQFMLHLQQQAVAAMPAECKSGWPYTDLNVIIKFILWVRRRGLPSTTFNMYSEFLKKMGFSGYKSGAGFTLIELLVVIGILAILAVVVVMSLNPTQLLSQSRDGRRLAEVTSLDKALALALVQNPDIATGIANRVYLSLPDLGGGTNCADYSTLPPLTSPWQYVCAALSTLRKIDGTGWIPINFGSLPMIPLDNLAVDPINDAQKGFYYTYTPGYEFNAQMESGKYEWGGSEDKESVDGGNTIVLYEKGTNLNAAPKEVNARITYELKVDTNCPQSPPGASNGVAFYPKWTVGSGLSGPAVVVKLLYWSPDTSLSSIEFVNMTIYRDGTPDYGRISSEDLSLYGTGQTGLNGWSSSTFNSPVPIQLGQNYFFGIVGNSIYNLAKEPLDADCAGYPPPGSPDTYYQFQGFLSAAVGTNFSQNFHSGFVGVVYAKN